MAGDSPKPPADLAVRSMTAVAMLLVSGAALWAGGMVWSVFVLAVGVGVWFEWSALCLLMYPPGGRRTAWRYGGAVYCGIACAVLMAMRDMPNGLVVVLMAVGAVIGTDVGAYAFGRMIGGPKIAPAISPSKTWAGLVGGILGAALVIALIVTQMPRFAFVAQSNTDTYQVVVQPLGNMAGFLLAGAIVAIVAQAGDFFESWMKRKAGVKDSGHLLPGHGGLFDRVDGLLAVCFMMGMALAAAVIGGLLMGQPLLPTPA